MGIFALIIWKIEYREYDFKAWEETGAVVEYSCVVEFPSHGIPVAISYITGISGFIF